MTDKQPEALMLSSMIERYNNGVHSQAIVENYSRAAAELRRLHEVNAELVEALKEMVEWYASRDADNNLRPALNQHPEIYEAMQILAKATGETALQRLNKAAEANGEEL